jgi:hydroxymethylbilane synthase
MHIKIGTRGSKLALWQAYFVQNQLISNNVTAEIVVIETKGDRILDVTLSKIGSKGVFTEELEQKLLSKEIDIAVHSAKDVQSSLQDGLDLIAFTEREKVNDVLVSLDSNFSIENSDKKIVIGSSSTRRVAFLKHYYPHVSIVDMRGNLQTRFEKLKNGNCNAMILAYAGVHRMNLEEYIVKEFDTNEFVPPVGQGSVAIECATTLDEQKKKYIREKLNHSQTEICLLAERAFLKEMNGGCSIPTFALAQIDPNNFIQIHAGIIGLDGFKMVSATEQGKNPVELGTRISKNILENGAKEILKAIKASIHLS